MIHKNATTTLALDTRIPIFPMVNYTHKRNEEWDPPIRSKIGKIRLHKIRKQLKIRMSRVNKSEYGYGNNFYVN